MCYVLKNGLCYVLCKTPWGAHYIKNDDDNNNKPDNNK